MSADWVLLSYRLPREPSTPRIAVWRKLKRMGVAQLGDGLTAVPNDPRTREQIDWLAAEIIEAGGSATVWIARPAVDSVNHDLAAELAAARTAEYVQLADEARAARDLSPAEQRAVRRRLNNELHRISRRDYFPPVERALAQEAVKHLETSQEHAA